ncbi:TIGR00341 family protein [Sulfurimonas sp.]
MKKNIKLFTNKNNDEKNVETVIEHINKHHELEVQTYSYKQDIVFDDEELVLLYLSDEEIKSFIKQNMNLNIILGIVPNKLCKNVMHSYGITSDITEALDDIFNTNKTQKVDVLFCNEEIVFNKIIIGDVHGLNQSSVLNKTLFSKIKSFFVNLFHLSFVDYTLVTSKEQSIQTAATGIMILEHSIHQLSKNLIHEDLSLHDGKLNALILAPSNVISYVYYLITSFFYHKFSINKLPKSIGIISTSKLDISSSTPLDFIIDGVGMSSKTINLEVKNDMLHIQLGRLIQDEQLALNTQKDEKDVIKVSSLPKGEMIQLLINDTVPIFKRADEEDFKELFIALKQNASLTASFVILMILSTLLATTGLFQNSAPVIIGAMVLAPLMAPIVSLAMGVTRGEQFLIKESAYTLSLGIFTALMFSSFYTYLMPLNTLTNEMSARLNPNILDLTVAIISGIAGAYASAKSEIAKSLAGVAIAVALVPPLSVTGIGIGYWDSEIIYGSFLLFLTNLVGITLSASMTFLILGYAPINRAKKGIIYTSVFLALVSIPLIMSFTIVLEQNKILDKIQTLQLKNKTIRMDVISVDLSQDKPNIFIEVHSDSIPTKETLQDIKVQIESALDKKITLDVTPKIALL